jgi:hypothetical protein
MAFSIKKQANLNFKKNTTFKIPRTPPFLPSSLGGLALWLKADAGVTSENYISYLVITGFTGNYTSLNGAYEMIDNYEGGQPLLFNGSFYISGNSIIDDNSGDVIATNNNSGLTGAWTPTTYFSTITLSGSATSSSVDGVYTRGDTLEMTVNTFVASGGGSISYDEDNGFWLVGPNDQYRNYNFPTGTWVTENGDAPAPTAVNSNSTRNVGSPTTSSRIITNPVSEWADQSGNGNNATPVADNPIYNISDLNSKPTISLTSMSDEIERVFSISINPLGVAGSTAFSVQYVEDVCDAEDDNGAIFGNFGESETQTHYPYGVDCLVYDSFATTSRKVELTPPTAITDTWSIYSVHSTNGEWKDYVNGQLMHSDPSNTYSNSVGGDDTTLYIGKQTGLGNFSLKGKVAEVIVYNRVLTTPERQQVEAYLNQKYAIY